VEGLLFVGLMVYYLFYMFKEFYQYLTTPTKPYVKRLGLLSESISLEARYLRCKAEWNPHYRHCKAAIIDAVARVKVKNTIVIVGAGSLRDIPLIYLADTFKRVVLIDLVFLRQARRQVAKYTNVELIEVDVTNGLGRLLACISVDEILSCLHKNPVSLSIEADCFVSLNLITQLPLVPTAYCLKKFKADAYKIEQLARLLIRQHLDLLNAQKGVRCLIADRDICEYDKEGLKIDCFDPAWEIDLPKPSLTWDWVAVPYRESASKYQQVHRVACSIWD